MTALLALITVATWGLWIPVAQVVPGVPQRSRTFYVTVANAVFATVALFASGAHPSFGWRDFWVPFGGGIVWTLGNYSAFRASETIGLARAAGTWTPLNIVTAFVWGAILGELHGFSTARFAVLGAALILVLVGVLFIVNSQDAHLANEGASGEVPAPHSEVERAGPANPLSLDAGTYRRGLLWAIIAGVLWGSYFVPVQWAKVPTQVGNFPLALGILAAGLTLTLPVLNAATRILFLVVGADKAETLRQVLEGPRRPEELPAQSVQPVRGQVEWYVEEPAARLLKGAMRSES